MISIQKYLWQHRAAGSQAATGLDEVVRLLIESMECYAVEGAPDEMARFRESTQKALAALDSNAPPGEMLEHAACVVEAMKRYNQEVVEYLRRPDTELQEKVKSLTAAITAIGCASSSSIGRLQQIKDRMLSSLNLKEIRDLRQLLSECLESVMGEAERQRAETDRAAEALNRGRKRPAPADSGAELPAASGLVCGLEDRARAEEAIAQACQDEAPAFIVVIVINQLRNVNRSFGPKFGDQMLQRFTAFLRQRLAPVDQLFRWSGPAVVALVRRNKTLEAVRLELAHPLTQRLAMKTSGSEVPLPISTRWTVLPLMASPRILFNKLDNFADSQ